MLLFNNNKNLISRQTRLLSKVSVPSIIIRGVRGKFPKVQVPSGTATQATATISQNAQTTSSNSNYYPGSSTAINNNSTPVPPVPTTSTPIPTSAPAPAASSSYFGSVCNIGSRLINTVHPSTYKIQNSNTNSFSTPTQTTSSQVNNVFTNVPQPTIYADPTAVFPYEIVPGQGAPFSMWNKIVYGVPAQNTQYLFGRILSTKHSYTNSKGEHDHNEIFDCKTTLKNGPGVQFVGDNELYPLSWFRPFNNYYTQLEPGLHLKLTQDVSSRCIAFNQAMLDPSASSYAMVGLVPALINYYLLK